MEFINKNISNFVHIILLFLTKRMCILRFKKNKKNCFFSPSFLQKNYLIPKKKKMMHFIREKKMVKKY